MSFGPGHVVVLLIVIALVVPTLLQMCDAPGSQSCTRSTRSSTPQQWAARPADRRPLCQEALRRPIPFCSSADTSSATVHGTLAVH